MDPTQFHPITKLKTTQPMKLQVSINRINSYQRLCHYIKTIEDKQKNSATTKDYDIKYGLTTTGKQILIRKNMNQHNMDLNLTKLANLFKSVSPN